MRATRSRSIAYRLTYWVILFSTSVALIATALQLYLDYRQEVRDIRDYFTVIAQTSVRPLEESVWILDDLLISLQLEGLIKREGIVYAAVEMDGSVAWAKGTLTQTNSLTHDYPLLHKARGRTEQIGRLMVVASLEGVYQRLLRRVVIILISNTVKTFLVAGFILLLFQRSITRHLIRLSEYLQDIDIRHFEPAPLCLKRRSTMAHDELDQVTAAINFLCASGRKAFTDLQMQEQRLRLFFDASEEVILGLDTRGRCTFINRAGLEYFNGKDQEAVVGRDILAMLAEAGQRQSSGPSGFVDQIRTTVSQACPLMTDEMPLVMPDGRELLVSLRSYPLVEEGQCTGAVVFLADISRQQRLEQEKLLFTKVIRQAPALILIADARQRIEYANTRFEQVMGAGSRDLVGSNVLQCFQELQTQQPVEEIAELLRRGESWLGGFSFTNRQGRRIIVETSVFPIFDRRRKLTNVVVLGRDVTREQQLVEQLHHAQKMEAIGKLAASIAHEFGNPLLGIRFALRDIQQRSTLSGEDRNLLNLAESECDRMRKLIRDLQQFNRPSTGRKKAFVLHQALEEILALHANLLARKRITVVRQYAPRPIRLWAVEDQLRQVFINLILNAVDAMTETGGVLTVCTELLELGVAVSIQDTGHGIDPENLNRIFEPFFTTKPSVEGTGLGLPVSYGIVRAHGGTIEVISTAGNTVFVVNLPLSSILEEASPVT